MNYPSGINKTYKNKVNYGNRGMTLEEDINNTNEYYRTNNIAVIHKKPIPITIAKVDYISEYEAIIREAYFKSKSTTDYNGIYKGKYIDFETKETKLEYFPLSSIHHHQIEHLKKIIQAGGIGFVIVKFVKHNKTFFLDANKLIKFIDNKTRKSIPLTFFEKEGYIIEEKYNPRLDYLKIIDNICFKGE